MKANTKFKKGDSCFVAVNDTRLKNFTDEIVSAGNKWITTKICGSSNRFDTEYFHSEIGGYKLYRSEDEFNEECMVKDLKRELIEKIRTHDYTIEQLHKMLNE